MSNCVSCTYFKWVYFPYNGWCVMHKITLGRPMDLDCNKYKFNEVLS